LSTEIEQINWMHWIYRLIALIIDSIITGIIGGILFTVLGVVAWWGAALLFPFIYGIILVIYSAILETSWNGMTIGKKLLGMQVQTTSAGKLTFDKAIIRNISKIYWLLLLLDWLVGIVTPGNKMQKYTDRMAGTVVVQTNQQFATAPPPPPPPPPPT
jgi:uncharacterized RDD family membrane protein YckC